MARLLFDARVDNRRRLLDRVAWEILFVGEREDFRYAPPIVRGGPTPPRMLEFTWPISLDPPFAAVVRDVELAGRDAIGILPNGRIILETLIFPSVEQQQAALGLDRGGPVETEIDLACSLVHRMSSNYFHWVLERLTLLEAVDAFRLKTGQRPVLIVDAAPRPWQLDSLRALGYCDRELVRWTLYRARVNRLLVPSVRRYSENGASPSDCLSPQACRWLRERAAGLDPPVARTGEPTGLYISRRKASSRRVLNEESLLEMIEPLGFQPIHPEELSFSEQVGAFARARAVIAPHGAGLTNIVFAQPGTPVLEFLPHDHCHPDFFQLSRAAGLTYGALICRSENAAQDMRVDLAEIAALLKKLVP